MGAFVTTPTTKAVGFSVHPPAQWPASPKAVPPPLMVVRPGDCAAEQFQLPMRVAQTVTILPGSGLPARTANRHLFRCEHLY
jgi:hypothetical protein